MSAARGVVRVAEEIDAWLYDELYRAYIAARKHKRATQDEHKFEVNDTTNLVQLTLDIQERRYQPSRGVAFITHDPVMREIFAAPFRDRVVHHFLYNQVYDWWDKRFIYDSYSCRVGKGTLLGIERLQKHMRQVSQMGKIETYVIKMDLQGYFMSLPRKEVYDRVCWGLEQQFCASHQRWLKKLLSYLWSEIIFDDPTDGVRIRGSVEDWRGLPDNKSLFCQPPGQGIVIGNLSSQLISNIYLDQLDRFVTLDLGYRHYGRYVDDFYIVVPQTELKKALRDLWAINDFLRGLKLTLHPHKQYIQNIRRGVPFLGVVIYPNAIVAGKRFRDNFRQALKEYQLGVVDENSIVSYMGYLKHTKGAKLARQLFRQAGLTYRYCYQKKFTPRDVWPGWISAVSGLWAPAPV